MAGIITTTIKHITKFIKRFFITYTFVTKPPLWVYICHQASTLGLDITNTFQQSWLSIFQPQIWISAFCYMQHIQQLGSVDLEHLLRLR